MAKKLPTVDKVLEEVRSLSAAYARNGRKRPPVLHITAAAMQAIQKAHDDKTLTHAVSFVQGKVYFDGVELST